MFAQYLLSKFANVVRKFPMAKQNKVDYSGMGKTDAVRAFLNEHRGEIESRQMGNQDILDGLKAVGVEVSPATLNNVKKEMGLTSQRGPRAAGNGTPRRRTASISAFPSDVNPNVVRHVK